MSNQQDSEEDDDFECYFLKPVNEYNIIDKIKQANQDLFEIPIPNSPSEGERKVQFRKNLEDYSDGVDNISIVSCDSNETVTMKKLEEITEEEYNEKSESEVEDICEEIIELDLDETENNSILLKNNSKAKKSDFDDLQLKSAEKNYEINNLNESSDDDLSILVATYIEHDNFESDTNLLTSTPIPETIKSKPKPRKFFIGKKKKSKISITEQSNDINESIKFNHRICCEYKTAKELNEHLPKYTGYLTEYGLSEEQWEKREKNLNKRKKFILEKRLKSTETELRKMEDNERAFTRWLKNKMRFSTNRTKNMFNVNPKIGSPKQRK